MANRSVHGAVALLSALALLLLVPASASAALERVGPTNPAHGFPFWYQDETGLTLDLCVPADTVEAALCALPDSPPAGFPETFPNNWVDEHFYWTGEATADVGNVSALLVLALESTFSAEIVRPGDQTVFGRVRIRVDPLTNGIYRVYTPFGVREFNVTAGEINMTEDIGIACAPGSFDCALQSGILAFLVPSADNEPGGPEKAPIIAANGRQYIADPNVATRVTGSKLGTYTLANGQTRNSNIFLVERVSPGLPTIVAETYDFNVSGRLFNGTVTADVKVNRASYASDGGGNQVDVYATGFPAKAGRVPPAAPAEPVAPALAFYSVPCAGGPTEQAPRAAYTEPAAVPVQMIRNDTVYWQRETPTTLPEALCVRQNIGTGDVFVQVPLADQIFVTKALYTPETRALQVEANSSDVFTSELTLGGFGNVENTPFDGRSLTVVLPENEGAPPSTVRVFSTQGGQGEAQVTTRAPALITPATSVDLTANLTSPQSPGITVTFTAQGQGSNGPYEYQFWVSSDGGANWTEQGPFSSVNTFQWTPGAGSYQVAVWVRTAATSGQFDATNAVSFVIATPRPPPATGVTLTPPTAATTVGTAVEFTAAGQGSSNYEYQFFVSSDGGANWVSQGAFSTEATFTFPAASAGNYLIGVWVRTSDTVEFDFAAAAPVSVTSGAPVPGPATGVTIAPEVGKPSPHTAGVGETVEFTATATGSSGYSYQFWQSTNGGVSWTSVQPYSNDNTFTFPAETPGDYWIAVWVRTSDAVDFDKTDFVIYQVVAAP